MNGSTAFGYFWRNKSIVVAISNGEIFSMDPAAMLRIPQDDKEGISNTAKKSQNSIFVLNTFRRGESLCSPITNV